LVVTAVASPSLAPTLKPVTVPSSLPVTTMSASDVSTIRPLTASKAALTPCCVEELLIASTT
jgi:hypothetical protein